MLRDRLDCMPEYTSTIMCRIMADVGHHDELQQRTQDVGAVGGNNGGR